MPSIAKWIRAGSMAVLTSACSGVSLHGPGTSPPQTRIPVVSRPAQTSGTTQTICRTSTVPAGYVITDFVASRACDTWKDRPFNAMLVEDISRAPLGTVMLICSNQPRPSDWEFTSTVVGVTGQCPRDPADKATSPTVKEIVRRREAT